MMNIILGLRKKGTLNILENGKTKDMEVGEMESILRSYRRNPDISDYRLASYIIKKLKGHRDESVFNCQYCFDTKKQLNGDYCNKCE